MGYIALRIGSSLFAVKDVVGADINTQGINLRASLCHGEGTQAVHTKGLVRMVLRFINSDKRGTVDDDVRAGHFQSLSYRNRIGAFDFLMTESDDFIISGLHQDLQKIRTQLSGAADDGDSHHVEGLLQWLPIKE